jgi:hypothetical protein
MKQLLRIDIAQDAKVKGYNSEYSHLLKRGIVCQTVSTQSVYLWYSGRYTVIPCATREEIQTWLREKHNIKVCPFWSRQHDCWQVQLNGYMEPYSGTYEYTMDCVLKIAISLIKINK